MSDVSWLREVQDIIDESIMPVYCNKEDREKYIKHEIAHSAKVFFKNVSDILPVKPFIYASKKGDIVAEYESLWKKKRMTHIIGKDFVIIFIVVGENIEEKRFSFYDDSFGDIREYLKKF